MCYLCKKDTLNAAKREQRASVVAIEYLAFMDSHATSDASRTTKDMAEQIKRFAEIDARKAKLLVQQQAMVNALPGIMATKVNLTNPFAVSAAQKAEAAQRQAQQRAAVQAQVQQAPQPIPVQPQPVQVQPSQAEVQQALQYVNQMRAENERIRAENNRTFAELQQQLGEIQREKEQNQLERDEINRVRATSKNKKVHGMQDLVDSQTRKERRERAANAALDREAEEEVDQIMYDMSNHA